MKASLLHYHSSITIAGYAARCLLLGALFVFCTLPADGQVIFSSGGTSHGNSDGRTFDFYGPADISNCTSVSFSLDYFFSLPWEGSGNMESCDEGCIGITPCACDPNILAVPNDGCHNCWDFLWVRFMIDGVEVGGDLIGDVGTTDAEQTGTISGTFCTNGLSGNASIEVYTQTWGATPLESVTFTNITITCIDDTPILPALGPFCATDAPVALNTSPGGIAGTWSGIGVTGGNTFNPAIAGVGAWNLTFTANPGSCAGSATTTVTVTPAATVNLTPIGPFCQTDGPTPLSTNQGGFTGSWSGPGVSGNQFNPAAAGTGPVTITFTPTPGQCAAPANLSVQVNTATTPTFGPIGPFCETGPATPLPLISQNGISGSWSGSGVSGNQFNPGSVGSGSFSILFTPDPGQCAATATASIQVDAVVTPALTPIGPFCTGDPSVPLPTVVDGVSGNWTGSLVMSNVFNPGSAGNWTITFTPDPGQCAAASTLMVQITPAATPVLDPLGPFCSTDAPVSLPAVQDGITGSWIGNGVSGGNTFNPAVTGGGAFQLTFIPAPGECANNNSISVMVNSPVANPPGQPLQVCYTLIPFSFTDNLPAILNAINGGTGQQINWYLDPAATNSIDPTDPSDIQALILGGPNQTIYAAVFDGACESATVPVNIVLTQSATPALTPIGPFCQGDGPTPLATVQSGISGSWSGPGVNNNTFNPNAAGSFTLTFTPNAGQCASPNTLNVTVNALTTPALTPIGPFCPGAPPASLATVQSGISGSWSGPGVNNNTFTPTAAGSFTLTFTPNAGQCANPNTLNVTVSNITANNAGPLFECGNGAGQASFNLTALNPQVSQGAGIVNWYLDAGTTALIGNPGNFMGADGVQVYATVTDGACESSPVPVQLFVLPLPAANPITLLECATTNGTASFDLTAVEGLVSGGAAVAVSWSFDPAGNTTIPNPAAFVTDDATVYAIVFDGSCQNSAPATLTVLEAPELSLAVASPILCNGDDNGSLDLTILSGQANLTYDWNADSYDGIEDPSGLEAGTYTVTVSGGNGCPNTASITLDEPTPVTMGCAVTNPVITPGGAQGEASVDFTGGTPPYNISWAGPVAGSGASPDPGMILLSGLEEGTYTATVEDNNGCITTCTFTVNGPGCDVQVDFENLQPESCPGALDGSVGLAIIGGTAPFSISWSDGPVDVTTRTGLAAGLYSVTVDDSDGCQATGTLLFGNTNPAPQLTVNAGDTICDRGCFVFDIQFQGTPPFMLEYAVDTGSSQQVFLLESPVADTLLEVCAADYGYSDGPLEVLFALLSDSLCTDTLNQLEVIQVRPSPNGAFNVVLCPGDSLTYNGAVYNAANPAGNEILTGQAANGCDSIVAVSVGYFPADTTLNMLLSCDPTQAGADTLVLQSVNGCDSIVITETAFVPSDTVRLTASSCDPADIGIDTVFLQNTAGCDSLVITETLFDANAADTTLLSMSTCDPAQTGRDTVFLQNASGCDSLVITETTLDPGDMTFLFATTCDPGQAGADTLFLQNAAGCDSLVFIQTTLAPSDTTVLLASTCDPAQAGADTLFLQNTAGCDSLVITETTLEPGDETFLTANTCDPASAGIDTVFLQNAAGCDSLVITETTLEPGDETFLTATTCNPSQAGIDTVFLINTAGCDSLVITETTLEPGDEAFLTATTCDPASAGIDTVFLQNAAGCDSLVITETTLEPGDEAFLTATTCDPASAGIDTVFLQNAAGCDSLVITETLLEPSDETFLTATTCNPNQAGVDTVFLINTAGCDSLVITETTLEPSDEAFLTATTCNASLAGVDTVFLINTAGCDSLVITETTLEPSDEAFLTATTCNPSQAGIDTVFLINTAGCDSLVITETLLEPSDETFLTATTCNPSQAGVDTVFLINTAGCDSLVITETTLEPSDEVFLTATTCNASLAGVDTVFLINTAGCDSLVITETLLEPSDETFLTANTCDPASAGIDTAFLQNAAGCDSLVITETLLLPSQETFLTTTTCDPGQAGIDTVLLQTTQGCDSLVITEATLLSADTTFIEEELCSGEVLVVNGREYSEALPSGMELIPGGAANGCDSIISIELSFIDAAIATLNSTLCPGAFVLVNGQRYDEANPMGTEVIENGSANGCDSIIQVALTFAEQAFGFLEGGRAICPGDSVELTIRLQGADTYNVTISNGAGPLESFTDISEDVTFTVSPAVTTTYQISLLTAVGSICPVEIGDGATVSILQADDLQAEVLTDYGGFGVSCSDREDASVGVSVSGAGLSFQWNTGQSAPTLDNLGPGVYTVTVTSPAGCSVVDSVQVAAPAPIAAQASGIGVNCFSALSGSIRVDNLEGGAGPYEYSLDGQFFTPLGALPATIPGLEGGQYTLYIQDANDCQVSLTAEVAPFEGLPLELGKDTTLKLGDSLQLRPQAGFEVAAFSWTPLTGLLDSAAFTPYVRPMETTAYTLTAVDSAGCSASDQIFIFINKERGLYAPNAFSPNEDGRNDFFTLYAGPDVVEIRAFRIFDRWGGLLFERGPFQPNIENLGWDGAFNGQPMDPAVFVFYAEVEYVDGFTEVVEGDFTLMR